MQSPTSHRLTFGQLSVGLQVILILILVGSCGGASRDVATDQGATFNQVQTLTEQVTNLESDIRRLRSEVRRLSR